MNLFILSAIITVVLPAWPCWSLPLTAPPVTEADLAEFNRLIDRIPDDDLTAGRYNPRDMVAAVNALRLLDKQTALRVVRHCGGRNRILILRFLFEAPDGRLPPPMVDSTYQDAEVPTYPAVVIEGVPLYVSIVGGGGGMPSVYKYLDWYREHGIIRANPLQPADDPRVVWTAWLQSDVRKRIKAGGRVRFYDRLVQEQLLRMVETVHPREFDEDTLNRLSVDEAARLWERAVSALETVPTSWDQAKNLYVRAIDGSYVEPVPESEYRRVSWRVPIDGREAQFEVLRVSEEIVLLSLRQRCSAEAPRVPDMSIRVVDAENPNKTIATLGFIGSFAGGTWGSTCELPLEKGVSLRALAIINGKVVNRSPVMPPDVVDPNPPRRSGPFSELGGGRNRLFDTLYPARRVFGRYSLKEAALRPMFSPALGAMAWHTTIRTSILMMMSAGP